MTNERRKKKLVRWRWWTSQRKPKWSWGVVIKATKSNGAANWKRVRGWDSSKGEGEMAKRKIDRERLLCVILWTPFIYTWNKRLRLSHKRLSWWAPKWNWHFQFVPWHVWLLLLFSHSSFSSPSRLLNEQLLMGIPFFPSCLHHTRPTNEHREDSFLTHRKLCLQCML